MSETEKFHQAQVAYDNRMPPEDCDEGHSWRRARVKHWQTGQTVVSGKNMKEATDWFRRTYPHVIVTRVMA